MRFPGSTHQAAALVAVEMTGACAIGTLSTNVASLGDGVQTPVDAFAPIIVAGVVAMTIRPSQKNNKLLSA